MSSSWVRNVNGSRNLTAVTGRTMLSGSSRSLAAGESRDLYTSSNYCSRTVGEGSVDIECRLNLTMLADRNDRLDLFAKFLDSWSIVADASCPYTSSKAAVNAVSGVGVDKSKDMTSSKQVAAEVSFHGKLSRKLVVDNATFLDAIEEIDDKSHPRRGTIDAVHRLWSTDGTERSG